MDINYFYSKKELIESKIEELQSELNELRKQYINDNALFKKGDEISVKGTKGVIVDVAIYESVSGKFVSFSYFWNKYKKDGTLSKTKYQLFENEVQVAKKL